MRLRGVPAPSQSPDQPCLLPSPPVAEGETGFPAAHHPARTFHRTTPRRPSERKPHERPNDAAAAADLHAADPRRAPPRRAADRVASRRRRHPPHDLPRVGRALAPHGQRDCRDGRALRRSRRHARLERLPSHGAVLRGQWFGRGAAHAESATAPRPGGVDRRPRRRPGAVLRPDLPAADRGHRLAREDDQDVRRDDRPRAHAGIEQGAGPVELRGADRGCQRRLHVAQFRREHRELAVLHVGHHRQPEGRAVQPPLDDAAHLCGGVARLR